MAGAVGRILATVLLLAVTAAATTVAAIENLRLYTASPLDLTDDEVVDDALPRLAFLREALDQGSAERMQTLFPEGYFFSYVLYGLTWVDVGRRSADLRERALDEARFALSHVDSPAGRAPFDAGLSPPYGVFYVGWSSWLRGGVVLLAGGAAAAPGEARRLADDVRGLAEAFRDALARSGSPFLSAYPGQAWPVDSAVGLAAVALASSLELTTDFAALGQRWLSAADARRDPATGLLPHRVEPTTGTPVEGARASSQTVLLRFLREVAPPTASRDWVRFRSLFGSTVPGAPGVREYPQGTDNDGDVDSGPLILGLSASASAVALGDAVLFRDGSAAAELSGLAEATGLAVNWRGQKRYAGGVLPIGDAFLAWSRVSTSWVTSASEPVSTGSSRWRPPWHLVTFVILVPLWLLARANVRRLRSRPLLAPDLSLSRSAT